MKRLFLVLIFTSNVLVASDSQSLYVKMLNSYQAKDWDKLLFAAKDVLKKSPNTTFSEEANYYLGVAYFNLKDYKPANEQFSKYLKQKTNPKFFFEALQLKFEIAEKLANGEWVRLMGWNKAPKMAPGKDLAVSIYDEIIAAIPHHEMTAKSLLQKATILTSQDQYNEAVETLEVLFRRFPKSKWSIEAFVLNGSIYLKQVSSRHQDLELLEHAELNLRHFKEMFPYEERVKEIEAMLLKMKESYASGIYDIALYFEANKKKDAAIFYYQKIISSYPGTKYAKLAQENLSKIK